MRSYLVFQNKSYMQERMANVLWAANKCMEGYEKYFFVNLEGLRKGDVVFNIDNMQIKSVSVVTRDAYPSRRPELIENNVWGNKGIVAELDYHDLGKPILLAINANQISKLCDADESPFDDDGEPRHGYIFEIPYTVHQLIIKRIQELNNTDDLQGAMLSDKDVNFMTDINEKTSNATSDAEIQHIVDTQGLKAYMRSKLLRVRPQQCAFCETRDLNILAAVYLKPWSMSSTTERVDVNNYMILCPNHRYLITEGLIAFSDMGIIMISDRLDFRSYKSLNINQFTTINVGEKEMAYIQWHRENIYK